MRIARARRWAGQAFFGATAILALTIANSHAATFSLSGGVTQNIADNFNPSGWSDAANNNIGVGTSISVFGNGAAGGLSLSGAGNVVFTYLGTEAGYTNIALFNGSQIFSNQTSLYGDTTGLYAVGAGLLPLAFRAVTPGNQDANNGGFIDEHVKLGIKLVNATLAYLFFEDIAIGGDGDFDDLVVRVEIIGGGGAPDPTPLPAAAWLFGSAVAGTAGIGAWRRRRTRAAV
jgi:hypothetical protein